MSDTPEVPEDPFKRFLERATDPSAVPGASGENQVPTGKEATQFKPGRSGNPKGRPKGSRNRPQFEEAFMADLLAAWEDNGVAAINKMIETDPGGFVRVAASLMPKQVERVQEDALDELSDEDIDAIVAVAKREREASRAQPDGG